MLCCDVNFSKLLSLKQKMGDFPRRVFGFFIVVAGKGGGGEWLLWMIALTKILFI